MQPERPCRTFAAAVVLAAGPLMSVGCGRASDVGARPPHAGSRAAVATPANPEPGQRWTHPSDGLAYVWVPPGSFQMGCVPGDPECSEDESPRHAVTLSRGYWLGQTEVTVGAFRAFVARTGHRTLAERRGSARVWAGDRWSSRSGASWRQPGFPQDEAHPVVCVSWDDAAAFCDSAGGRLPTEAEWERAARGGNEGMAYAWGSGRTPMRGGRARANVPDEAARRAFHWWVFEGYDDGHVYTSAVGCFPAGGFGLHDMAGNAAEWVADWHDDRYYVGSPATDPTGPSSGRFREVRGGSWSYYTRSLRLSVRLPKSPGDSQSNIGFRCAVDGR